MAKLPYLPFYPADWIVGTRVLTDEQKSILIDLISFMWLNDEKRGTIEGSWGDLSRTIGRDRSAFEICVKILEKVGAIELKIDDGIGAESYITIKSRRAIKHAKKLRDNAMRQFKYIQRNDALNDATNDGSTDAKVTRKISDVRSQKKDKDIHSSQSLKDKDFEECVPPPLTPEKLTDVQKVVYVFKLVSGYERLDKAWDKLNFARCTRSAKALIDFIGNWKDAANCVEDVYEKLSGKGLTVTLETVAKHAADWKLDHREQASAEVR